MKIISSSSVIYSMRTFAAAMLALYLSFQLDLSHPAWAFLTTYIISAPLRGGGRSKGLYRICGTVVGAAFTVLTVPTLVDAPELLTLVIALWIAFCLYLSILDGTPRAYFFILAGYTTALIGFPSVNAPQTIFDTAVARTEEIGMAIFCIELMGYLPFNQRAGDVLNAQIQKCFLKIRQLSITLMTSGKNNPPPIDYAQLIMGIGSLDTLRIQASYDTPHFSDIEAWVVALQRSLQNFFADLITFEAQLNRLRMNNADALVSLQPITNAILAWIESGEIAVPQGLNELFIKIHQTKHQQELIKSGAFDNLSHMVARREECLDLHHKIMTNTKADHEFVTIAHYVDYRQAAYYGLAVALQLVAGSLFWIKAGWPEGGTMVTFASLMCCFFSSLEAPPDIAIKFLILCCLGAAIGWIYSFVVFPHITGFVLFVYVLAFSCVPIGIIMSNPAIAGAMLPVLFGVTLASLQNRFDADITSFLNGFVPQIAGVVLAGAVLNFIRTVTLKSATSRMLNRNGYALALLAGDTPVIDEKEIDIITDNMTHRAALSLTRCRILNKEEYNRVVNRVLLDLQAERALINMKEATKKMSPDLQSSVNDIGGKIALYFSGRRDLASPPPEVCDDIRKFARTLNHGVHSIDKMRLAGFMNTLNRSMGGEAA